MKITIKRPFGKKTPGGRSFFTKDQVVDTDDYPEGFFDASMEVGHVVAVVEEPDVSEPDDSDGDTDDDPEDGTDEEE